MNGNISDQPNLPSASRLFRGGLIAAKNPLGEQAVQEFEAEFGVALPAAYTNLLHERNGGTLQLNGIWSKERPSPHHTDRPIYTFEQIAGIGRPDQCDLAKMSRAAHDVWEVPKALIPIDGDGHWWLCLDYRRCGPTGEPCITHFESPEQEGDEPVESRVADDFASLLTGLFYDSDDDVVAIDQNEIGRDRLAEILTALGATPRNRRGPQWWWSKYRNARSFDASNRCLIWVGALARNDDPLFPDVSGAAHLIHFEVDDDQRAACATELIGALGPTARLVHQPADRVQLRFDATSRMFIPTA